MIHLDSDKKSLETLLGEAISVNQLPIVVSFDEINSFGSSVEDTQTNGTTAVTIAEAPGIFNRPVVRKIKSISIFNEDTIAHKVIVRLNNDSVLRKIYEVILPAGFGLFYEDGKGFYILDDEGGIVSSTLNNDDNMEFFVAFNGDDYVGGTPKIKILYDGLTFKFRVLQNNTGAATLNINGLGAKALRNFGTDVLHADELKAGVIYEATYDAANDIFQISSTTNKIENAV